MTLWNAICLTIGDALLGWALRLSPTAALAALALLTGGLLVGARRWLSDQDLLKRVASDRTRIRSLLTEAKRVGDKAERTRLKTLLGAVGLRALSQEGKPMAAILLPLAVLATWGYARLAWVAPREGEPVEIRLHMPVSSVGRLAHLVPADGLSADRGWITEVEAEEEGVSAGGIARWTVRGPARAEPYALAAVCGVATYTGAVTVGHWAYADPVTIHDDGAVRLEVAMRELRLAGLPGRPPTLPAWIVGYLLLAIPASLGLKRVTGVA